MSSAPRESFSFLRFVGGVVLGAAMTFAWVRYSWQMPQVMQLPGKITEAAVVSTAQVDLFRPDASDDTRLRALAAVIGQQPYEFAKMDQELGGQIMEEVLRREAVRRARLLKQQFAAYDVALDQPALRRMLERKHGHTGDRTRLRRRMLAAEIRDDAFLSWYLTTRCAATRLPHQVDLVLDVYRTGLRAAATAEHTRLAVESSDRPN